MVQALQQTFEVLTRDSAVTISVLCFLFLPQVQMAELSAPAAEVLATGKKAKRENEKEQKL